MASSYDEMIEYMAEECAGTKLDAVTLNTDLVRNPQELRTVMDKIQSQFVGVHIICLASSPDVAIAQTAYEMGASAYLSREAVDLGVASAVCFAMVHPHFTVTEDLRDLIEQKLGVCVSVLPGRRHYARLTPRIEKALWLCVVEGMPAELAAEEMGVSVSTIRSYIKEGYRILEAEDDTHFPISVSPAERAFLRFTALDEEELLSLAAARPAA